MIHGEDVVINGDGETTRDFCYVADVVQANILAATCDNPAALHGVFNIARHGKTTLNELFEILRTRLAPFYPHLANLKPAYRDFRPGDDMTVDVGFRYLVSDAFATNLQINTRYKRRDSGANAEPNESGGAYVYLSPGLSYAFADGFQVYGYVQVPLFQDVNGIQLTQSSSYVAGVSYRF